MLTATPMGLTDKNLFAYCDNNPVMREDCDGAFWDIVFDIVSLVVSVVEVIQNPDDSAAWLGLAGDVIDLIPGVTGVGEATRSLKIADNIGDAIDTADDIADTGKVVQKGWHVGDDITNLTAAGNAPSWSTVRNRYWKNEAHFNAANYSESNLVLMKRGRAPLVELNGKAYPMELHHIIPRRNGGSNAYSNLLKVTPWEHDAIDPFRHFLP